jgi:hypothetical protein
LTIFHKFKEPLSQKMKKLKIYFIIPIVIVALLSSCRPDVEYPVEPKIEFLSFTSFEDDSAHLIFTFQDGDGDIGLSQDEILEPYDFNVFLTYSERQNGEWVDFVFDEIGYNYRIPVLNPGWKEKSLEGEVKITLIPYFNGGATALSDTFKWSGYMKDRALHESNSMETEAYVKP